MLDLAFGSQGQAIVNGLGLYITSVANNTSKHVTNAAYHYAQETLSNSVRQKLLESLTTAPTTTTTTIVNSPSGNNQVATTQQSATVQTNTTPVGKAESITRRRRREPDITPAKRTKLKHGKVKNWVSTSFRLQKRVSKGRKKSKKRKLFKSKN